MSRSINKITLLGNVGQDPEVRKTQAGATVAKISVATNYTYKDRNGQKQEKVQWHRVTFWNKLAEVVEQYVHKGDRIYVEGRLEYSTAEKDGVTQYFTDIQAVELVMLGASVGGAKRDDKQRSKPIAQEEEYGGKSGYGDANEDMEF